MSVCLCVCVFFCIRGEFMLRKRFPVIFVCHNTLCLNRWLACQWQPASLHTIFQFVISSGSQCDDDDPIDYFFSVFLCVIFFHYSPSTLNLLLRREIVNKKRKFPFNYVHGNGVAICVQNCFRRKKWR